jgi:choline dehydrogenase-like flavoprotein
MSDFDAIVIGSGVSGGWAAKELTEKGLKVLLLERGRPISPETDYPAEHKAPWDLKFRGAMDRRMHARDYPIQGKVVQCEEEAEYFFVKDSEQPYVQDVARPFSWIRGDQLGGRSLTWGRATPRWGALNFLDNAKDGHGIDWPIRYDDLKPWYDHVEDFAGISGQRVREFATAPNGVYLPPLELNYVEQHVADAIDLHYPDRGLIPAPTAVLSQDHRGRPKCHFCGPCHRGCSTGSYFSSISSTLPAAQATGNLTTITDAIVAELIYDPATGRVGGVRAINAKTRVGTTYHGRIVFLNASTLGTAQILLQSRSAAFPTGLANGSGTLGRYLMDHVMGPRATGVFDEFLDKRAVGNRPSGIYIPRFRNVGKSDAPFLRGYGYQGSAARSDWTRGMTMPGFGADLKTALRQEGKWSMFLAGVGECLPNANNRVELTDQTDRWGLPLLKVSFTWGPNEQAMALDMADEAEEMLRAAGASSVRKDAAIQTAGLGVHEMGTARMGHDPKTSVLNGRNQAHEVANLFVTDGACMSSSAAQNPSITYMALTARATGFAVDQLKAGVL